MAELPFQNRRQYVRIRRNFMLSCRLKADTRATFQMYQVHDISRSGVSFNSMASFLQGSALAMELKTPFLTVPVLIEGVVVACVRKTASSIYMTQIQFTQISGQAMGVLLKIEENATRQR